jgi:hypothetical protein
MFLGLLFLVCCFWFVVYCLLFGEFGFWNLLFVIAIVIVIDFAIAIVIDF